MKKVLIIIILFTSFLVVTPTRGNVLFSPFQYFKYEVKAESILNKADLCYNRQDYDSSRFYLEKACEIYNSSGNSVSFIHTLLKISENYVYLKRFELAKGLIIKAEKKFAQSLNDKKLKNRFNLAWGYYFNGLAQWTISNEYLFKYLTLAKKEKFEFISLYEPYTYIAYNFLSIGNYKKAIESYKNAIYYYSTLKTKSNSFYLNILLGLAQAYLQSEDFVNANNVLSTCVNLYQYVPHRNHDEYSMCLYYKSIINKSQGRYSESALNLNLAEVEMIKYHETNELTWNCIYSTKGSLSIISGDFENALLNYKKALALLKSESYYSLLNRSIAYNNIANIYVKTGDYKSAVENIQKSIQYAKETRPEYLWEPYNLASECYLKLNEPQKAIEYYNLSINNIRQYLGANHTSLARAHLTRARISLQMKKYEEGNQFATLALEIATKKFGNKHPLIAEAYQLQGDLAFASGKTEDALTHYQQAVCAISRGFENKNVFSNPQNDQAIAPMQLLSILKSKAEALTQSGENQTSLKEQHAYYDAALQSYDLADQLVAALRTGYTSRESKLMLADAESETYNKATRLAVKMFNETKNQKYLETAFSLSEKNKSSVLLGSLRDDESLAGAGIPPKMIQYEKSLKQNIGLLENMIYEEDAKPSADPKKRSGYESRLLAFRQEHSRLLSQLEKYSPAYVRLKYKNNTASLATIQKMMAPKTAIVEYALVDSMMYTFLITHDQVNVITHTTDSSFYKLIADFRSSLTDNDFSDYSMDDYSAYVRSASKLYDQLLLPVKKELEGKSVIFIPEDKLGYIPFEALLTSLPTIGKVDFNNLPYVIASNPVSYSYSATLLSAPFHNNTTVQTENRMLAYAPDYKSSATSTNAKYRSYTTRNGLQNLPAAAEEVNQIEKYFDIVKVDGREATEGQFKKESKDFDVLHLAMHAVVDNENPQFSKLVFAPGDTAEDGLLNASEIMNMDLKARMVVLSACNTGFGKILRGEGVFSVARAFLYAGCSSVVMTLWSVEDNSSAQLMDYFYSNLSKGETKDLALQQAKLNYIRNVDPVKAHPYFWAGYVNIGNTAAITEPKDATANASWPLLTGAGVLGFTLVFAFRKKVLTLFAR